MKEHSEVPRLRLIPFALAIGAEMFAALILFAFAFPSAFGAEASRPWGIVLWTFLFGLPLSLFEYVYHRYLLHSAVLPFMAAMHRAHATHHGLTSVKAPISPKDPGKMVTVTSEYPIEEPHQEESMMFPLWSLPIFLAVFMILLGLPLKWLFPDQPVITALIFAVTLYYVAYEAWHAVLHLPYERFWQPMMERRWSHRLFKRLYGFHLMHHWRPKSNLAIVGFWGFGAWDHLFRTHRRPERLPLDGAEVSSVDAQLNKPLWPISLFDKWQGGMYRASRTIERFLARVFLRRKAE
ncbi:MAG TPA: hypothetical protein PLH94_12970 [Fimbriimonadaceae bacterium]|nr:hypothetical protein [Fimbriimonadaceae bacterium]